MPDMMTHAFLALDVLKNIENNEIIKNNKELFLIGAQGPDPYFYYNFYPWKNSNNIPAFGGVMHKTKTRKFFVTYLEYLSKNFSDEGLAFILGWICHYALDTNAHPYVFHVTGIYDGSKETRKYRGNHLALEKGIDSIFLKERGYDSNKYNPAKEIFTLESIPESVTNILDLTIFKVHQVIDMGVIYNQGYLDFKKSINILQYDPFGMKKFLYKVLDLFNKKSAYVYKTLSYHNNVLSNIDYLNIKKKEWKHPSSLEISNETFNELYSKAIEKATFMIDQTIKYLDDNNIDIEELFDNLSYETGKDCELKLEIIHFNSIL
ncbi:zinc dependent phospholipase C family protein [Mycoplasmatota bacterium zrk1]